jgi:predicted  nucleic acid-binding Zn-ribbon protein
MTKLGKRKCKNCGEVFQKQQPLQYCCSIPCGIEYSRKMAKKEEDQEWNKVKKEKLEKLKGITEWKNDLQKVVNWIAREIDKDQDCVSHPNLKNFLRYDAGHAFTVKAHSDIRYNLHNIHKQSSEANERHGYCVEYQQGLRARYGDEYLRMVEGLPLKWNGTAKDLFTIDNIQSIFLPNARRIQREMKKGIEYTRDEVNRGIGIYIK